MSKLDELKVNLADARQAAEEAHAAHVALVDRYEAGDQTITIDFLNGHTIGCQAFEDAVTAAYNELQAAYQEEIDAWEDEKDIIAKHQVSDDDFYTGLYRRYHAQPELIEFYT